MTARLYLITSALAVAAAASPAGAQPAALMDAYRAAWARADAPALAALFEPEGRLVIPSGTELAGRAQIAQFFEAAFASGYRGSVGEAAIARLEPIGANAAVAEGRWAIRGARTREGRPRPDEAGRFMSLVRRGRGGQWRIAVLFEAQPPP